MTRRVAGVVLAGGASRRMGRPKAGLPFGRGTLLDRCIALVRGAADEVWISTADADSAGALEAVSAGASVRGVTGFIHDAAPGRGPLAALHTVLRQLARPVLFVACDLPFLAPDDLLALTRMRTAAPAVVLADDDGPQPLAAFYRPEIVRLIEARLAAGEFAMRDLLAHARFDTLRARDVAPGCAPLANINTEDDYARAVRAAVGAGLISFASVVPD
ncbi:MAG: molybdenum cofactor guanylyltransferase [bacterium]